MKTICALRYFYMCFAFLGTPALSSFFDYYTTQPFEGTEITVQTVRCLLIKTAPAPDPNGSTENVDLVEFLNTRTLQRDSVFSEAIHLLESMKSSPSCNRIAATRLLTSCQTLDDHAKVPTSDISMTLDRVKSLYAARLAICELSGAGTTIPAACAPLQVDSVKTHNGARPPSIDVLGSESLDPIPSTMLDACLKALESRPQWWTSYSNSRQNAMVICQAARIEVEKEELLKLHRSLAENTSKLNKGLQEALRNAAADSGQHRAFVEAIEIMRATLLRDLENSSVEARGLFSRILNEIETAIRFAVEKVISRMKDVETHTANLSEVCSESLDRISANNLI
jgi:hypothetical protein